VALESPGFGAKDDAEEDADDAADTKDPEPAVSPAP
jgi:hypothetical protein